jgi:hypothetical protein
LAFYIPGGESVKLRLGMVQSGLTLLEQVMAG